MAIKFLTARERREDYGYDLDRLATLCTPIFSLREHEVERHSRYERVDMDQDTSLARRAPSL